MRRILAIATIALLPLTSCESADDECNRSETDRKLVGCTAAIERPGIGKSDLAIALSRRSDAHVAMGNLDAAIADRIKALELEPQNGKQRQRLSELHRVRADVATDDEKRIAGFTEALRIDPTNHVALFGRAAAHLQKSNLDAAIGDLAKAHEIQPSEPVYKKLLANAHQLRGLAHAGNGDASKAIKEFTRSVSLETGNGELHMHRGDAHVALKQLANALGDYDKAVELAPDSNDALLRRAQLHMTENRLEPAIDDLGKVIQRDVRNTRAFVLRGMARELGDFLGHAKDDYEAALRIDPKNTVATEGLRRIAAFQGKSRIEPPKEATVSTDDPDSELVKLIQQELERVGCDPGEIDGVWGNDTKEALADFNKRAGASLDTTQPTEEALRRVKTASGRVCPEEQATAQGVGKSCWRYSDCAKKCESLWGYRGPVNVDHCIARHPCRKYPRSC